MLSAFFCSYLFVEARFSYSFQSLWIRTHGWMVRVFVSFLVVVPRKCVSACMSVCGVMRLCVYERCSKVRLSSRRMGAAVKGVVGAVGPCQAYLLCYILFPPHSSRTSFLVFVEAKLHRSLLFSLYNPSADFKPAKGSHRCSDGIHFTLSLVFFTRSLLSRI